MSILLSRAFNQVELNKAMKKAKKETFFYSQEIGFCNGYMIIADTKQVRSFIKNEFMFVQDMFSRHGEKANADNKLLQTIKEPFEKHCTIKASITEFTKQSKIDMVNKRSLRVFKCEKGNFLIDTNFLNVISNPFSDDIVYYTDSLMQRLFLKTKDGEFIAGILGIRSDDEERALLNSVDGMEV